MNMISTYDRTIKQHGCILQEMQDKNLTADHNFLNTTYNMNNINYSDNKNPQQWIT